MQKPLMLESMKHRLGFTLVELLVAITIMLILVIVGVVTLRSTQPAARDKERQDDVASIARALEIYYESGEDSLGAGGYPSTAAMDTESEVRSTLSDLDPDTLRTPDTPTTSPISLIVATTTSAQSPTVSQYIYQPIQSDGTLCTLTTQECRKFTLYYQLETESGIKTIVSKHQ